MPRSLGELRRPASLDVKQQPLCGGKADLCHSRPSPPLGLADFTLAQKGPDLPLSDLSRLDPIAIARLGERLITNDAPDPAELCYPPPRFTPSHFPYFPPSAGGAAGSAKDGLAQKRTRKGVWSCSFGDPQIPQAPPADLLNRVRRLHRTEFDKLSRLFAERPVWLRSALRLYFPEIGFNELRMYITTSYSPAHGSSLISNLLG